MKKNIVISALTILLLISVTVIFFIFSEEPQEETLVPVRFIIELYDKPDGFANNININLPLFESIRDTEIGVIKEVFSLPFLVDVINTSDRIINRLEVYGREFTYIVIEGMASVNNFQTTVNNIPIRVNSRIYVFSKDFASAATVVSIRFL